jgi:hypothetical protein
VRADAPVAAGAVTVALVGHKCDVRTRRDMNDILDLVVHVRLTNTGATPAPVDPSQMKLVVGHDETPPDEHPERFELAAGAPADVRLHYHRWGNAGCDAPMALALGGAVANAPASLLSFVPRNTAR